MLLMLTPSTFEFFNVVTSVEGFKQPWAIEKAKLGAANDPSRPTHGAHHH